LPQIIPGRSSHPDRILNGHYYITSNAGLQQVTLSAQGYRKKFLNEVFIAENKDY
jgi:hypothetical protein